MTGVRHEQLAAGIHAVIIDRPDKRNACDVPTWECLANAFEDAALNPDIRVLVFTGADGHFCAGDDISATSQIASDPVLMQRRVNAMASTFNALRALPSSPFHQKQYKMKPMDFFARLGADPLPHCRCGKGMERRMVEKDAVSCNGFGETDY